MQHHSTKHFIITTYLLYLPLDYISTSFLLLVLQYFYNSKCSLFLSVIFLFEHCLLQYLYSQVISNKYYTLFGRGLPSGSAGSRYDQKYWEHRSMITRPSPPTTQTLLCLLSSWVVHCSMLAFKIRSSQTGVGSWGIGAQSLVVILAGSIPESQEASGTG